MAPGTPHQIVAVVPLIALVVVVTGVAVILGTRRQASPEQLLRRCGVGLVGVALIVVVSATFGGSHLAIGDLQLMPLKTLLSYLWGEPTAGVAFRNLAYNFLLLTPLGLGVRLVGQRAVAAVVIVLLTAIANEAAQLVVGRSSDVDDVILNSLGGAVAVVVGDCIAKRFASRD